MTREQILELDGPELSAEVARAMGVEVLVVSKNNCHVGYKVGDYGFHHDGAFNPHCDMNDVRKMWDFMRDDHILLAAFFVELDELIGGSGPALEYEILLMEATPRQYSHAFLFAVLEVGTWGH